MSSLTDPGRTVWGSFVFPVETVTTGISVVPEYDAAGRTVVHNTYTWTIETYLTGTATDAAVRAAVQQLTKPAYPFRYTNRGLGVVVNIGSVRDAVWGPKPISCDVVPLGAGNGVKLVWKVAARIPDCADAVYSFAMAEWNYSIQYSIDATGYTRRTHTGFVRIPVTRTSPDSRSIPDSADAYRERINPPLPRGFRRIPGEFTLSMDKARLDFSIVDEQLPPNILPPGIIDASADHTVSSVPMKFFQWNCTLNGTYELARGDGATIAAARDAFFRLLKDRIGTTLAGAAARFGGVGINADPVDSTGRFLPSVVVPVSFSFAEPEIYGHTKAKFSCTYQVTGAGLTKMLATSGCWRPVPDGDWFRWTASIATATSPRGHAALVFSLKDDSIVDLCRPSSPSFPAPTSLGGAGGGFGGAGMMSALSGAARADLLAVFPTPTLSASWLDWTSAVRLEANNAIVPIITLPDHPPAAKNDLLGGGWGSLAAVPPRGQNGNGLPANDVFYDADTRGALPQDRPGGEAQRRKQSCFIYFSGRAARVGFGIPCPVLERWGNVRLVPANRPDQGEGFTSAVIADAGWPVWGAKWNLRYWVPEVPNGIDLPVPGSPFRGQS